MVMRRVTKAELFLELAKLRNEGRLTHAGAVRIPAESRGSQSHIIISEAAVLIHRKDSLVVIKAST